MTDRVSGAVVPDGRAVAPACVGMAVIVEPYADTEGRAARELAATRAAYPAWSVWRSDEGWWWATRSRPLRPSRWPDGYALTVTAPDPFALGAQITRQPR